MNVAVIGAGMTRFGEFWNMSYRDLITEAGVKTIKDAGIEGTEIEALYVGSMTPGLFIEQEHIGALVADNSGLQGIPATRVEAACASGGLALREAYLSIKAGVADVVVAAGVEKMTDVSVEHATVALAGAGDQEWEAFHGATFPALYALMARRHMIEYGTTEEQMAMVAVKNHHNGSLNPNAQFKRQFKLEDVMSSAPVADPLKLLDCSPITDGAAAVILASEEKAKEMSDNPVWIRGSGQASDTLALHDRKSLCRVESAVRAANTAYKMAGVKAGDIDFAEVHDCFTIAELMAVESLGFCKAGEGGRLTEDGETALEGRIPVNASGGLKAKGHPVGATGVAQAVEATMQLRGDAGKRQVKDAQLGLTHNVGGSGATSVVHVFSREVK
ncbi:MAG: thiolase domain-containing protein [Candidatus Altiarchaeales archaeon]|nr:thiolase domain-containing protein [Candidatus Altiarchaeales archaeon]MBD3415609.1 thiolase domain-containing protein [Candidatus Altiarchaeales archaeon]